MFDWGLNGGFLPGFGLLGLKEFTVAKPHTATGFRAFRGCKTTSALILVVVCLQFLLLLLLLMQRRFI